MWARVSTVTSAAASLATDHAVVRLETVRGSGNYAALEGDFEGTATSAEHPACSIDTEITRTNNKSNDYTAVTVTVTAPTLDRARKKTTIIWERSGLRAHPAGVRRHRPRW